jgi:hypothetical protein
VCWALLKHVITGPSARPCKLCTVRVLCINTKVAEPLRSSTLSQKMLRPNSLDRVREPIIPTERHPLVGVVSSNLSGERVQRCQRDGSLRPYSRLSRQEPLLFLQSGSSVVLTRLSGLRSGSTTSQKIW